ncbi:hypothetical protein E2I00_010291, partial [Balaenoptera physalus]
GCIVFPGGYAWSNFTILALGVWAVAQRDSIDAISMVSWGSGGRTGLRLSLDLHRSTVPTRRLTLQKCLPTWRAGLTSPKDTEASPAAAGPSLGASLRNGGEGCPTGARLGTVVAFVTSTLSCSVQAPGRAVPEPG